MMDIQFLLNVFLILVTISMVHADEEYSYEDFAVDVGSGVAIAACEKDPACSDSMPAIMTIGFIIGGISLGAVGSLSPVIAALIQVFGAMAVAPSVS